MKSIKPLVNKKLLLEKIPGKGGWTYTVIKNVPREKRVKFGWVKVKGTIDNYFISKYNLMPMKDGNLFLPVRSEIRRKIGKQAGDFVTVILYVDDEPLTTPEEMLICLADEPDALQFYETLTESEKKYYTDWIYGAKKEETKIRRMTSAIQRLSRKEKFYAPFNTEE